MDEVKHAIKPTADQVLHGRDLRGRAAIVTGGATGIGRETTRALAKAGAMVIIACRNTARAEAVAGELRMEVPTAHVAAEPLDLMSPASVEAFASRFLQKYNRLDYLVHNAGVMGVPLQCSEDGFESHFATLYMGPLALTRALLPLLKASRARIVTLTSLAHRRSDIVYEDIHFRMRPYDAWLACGQANTAACLLAVALHDLYSPDGITANTVMPGGIMTGLQRHVPRERQLELGWIDEAGHVNPLFKTPAQGAATTVWALVAPELEGKGGQYLQNMQVAGPWTGDNPLMGYIPYALDRNNARKLWDHCVLPHEVGKPVDVGTSEAGCR